MSLADYEGEFRLRKAPSEFSPPLPDLTRSVGTTVYLYVNVQDGEVAAIYLDASLPGEASQSARAARPASVIVPTLRVRSRQAAGHRLAWSKGARRSTSPVTLEGRM